MYSKDQAFRPQTQRLHVTKTMCTYSIRLLTWYAALLFVAIVANVTTTRQWIMLTWFNTARWHLLLYNQRLLKIRDRGKNGALLQTYYIEGQLLSSRCISAWIKLLLKKKLPYIELQSASTLFRTNMEVITQLYYLYIVKMIYSMEE